MRTIKSSPVGPSFSGLLKSQSGVTLVLVLVLLAILGLSAGIAGSTWSSLTQRSREADLLWKGSQIRTAIGLYYEKTHGQGAAKNYPSSLEYLLKDPRSLETKRYLRRPWVDPMTGTDWDLIKDGGGRIKGVRSTSKKEPFKQGNFSEENKDFEGRGFYSEWEFVYTPKKTTTPAGQTPTGAIPPPFTGGNSPTGSIPPSAQGDAPPIENSTPPQE